MSSTLISVTACTSRYSLPLMLHLFNRLKFVPPPPSFLPASKVREFYVRNLEKARKSREILKRRKNRDPDGKLKNFAVSRRRCRSGYGRPTLPFSRESARHFSLIYFHFFFPPFPRRADPWPPPHLVGSVLIAQSSRIFCHRR